MRFLRRIALVLLLLLFVCSFFAAWVVGKERRYGGYSNEVFSVFGVIVYERLDNKRITKDFIEWVAAIRILDKGARYEFAPYWSWRTLGFWFNSIDSRELHGTLVTVPYWPFIMGFGYLELRSWLDRRRQARWRSSGRCPTCGFDLRATADRCP